MNNRLGYNMQTWQYLNFMDSCTVYASSLTDSLKCSAIPIGNIYQTSGTASMNDIRPTPDNGYVFVGYNTSGGVQQSYIVKTDHEGNVQWGETLGNAPSNRFTRVRPTADNGYIAVGSIDSANGNVSSELIVKFDFSGHIQWDRLLGYNTTSGEFGRDVVYAG
jgi:hypothetical protein